VPLKIKYQEPFREIIHDQDGSLTGLGENSWASFFYPHLLTEECIKSDEYNGVICNGPGLNFRRVAFFKAMPTSFRMEKIKVA